MNHKWNPPTVKRKSPAQSVCVQCGMFRICANNIHGYKMPGVPGTRLRAGECAPVAEIGHRMTEEFVGSSYNATVCDCDWPGCYCTASNCCQGMEDLIVDEEPSAADSAPKP